MKAVIPSKRRYTYRDIIRVVALAIGHYFFFIAYIVFVLAMHFLLKRGFFFPQINFLNWFIFYPTFIAPAVNASLHILYAEKGGPWFRFIMWVHTMINIILIPVAIFIS